MNAQSQKTVANCAELKIHIYECRKEPYLAAASSYHITVDPKLFMPVVTPYLAAFYALALNLGYGFFCGLLLFLINLSGSRVLGFAVLSGYENNNLRAGKERQPLCRQFNLQKNKMIDMIIALQYNEAVKSGIENI